MNLPTTFDEWRAQYDGLTTADHRALYDTYWAMYPDQNHASRSAALSFFSFICCDGQDPFRVFEIGGWKGELADYLLGHFPGIGHWLNREFCLQAVQASVCRDDRYEAVVPLNYHWWAEGPFPEADVFVSTHTFEHFREREVAAIIKRIGEGTFTYVYLEIPVELRGHNNWSGYQGTHILEVGWDYIDEMLQLAGFKMLRLGPTLAGTCRGYVRV